MASSFLSLVLPAYKQEKTIIKDIKNIEKTLSSLNLDYEIIVVVDGFIDDTHKKLKKIKNPRLIALGYEKNQGKGYAIKYGIERASGKIIGFMDAGMEIDPTEIALFLNIMDWNKADIVIGSKLHPDSIVEYPIIRKILSWGYRSITRALFSLNVKDTQVGIKFFRNKVAKDVFPKIVVKAFAFDVEVLAVAVSLGYTRIYEAPIKLKFKQGTITNSNFWRVSFWILYDTLAVYYRLNILKTYHRNKR